MSPPVPFDPPAAQTRRPTIPNLTLGQLALIVGVIAAFWALGNVLLLIFFSILMAASLRGAGDWVSAKTGIPVVWAVSAVALAIFGALAGVSYWAGPNLFAQLDDLTRRLMAEVERVRGHLQDVGVKPGDMQLQAIAERVASPVARIFTLSLSTVTELAVALVTALYFASSPSVYVGGAIRLAPIARRPRLREVVGSLAHVLRMWVLGQLISMLAVGVLSSLGLWLAGVPAPFALGLISGLLTFVPYVGTIVSGAIALVIAFSAGLSTAIWALVVFAVCHVVEGYMIAPIVQKRILDLPPALTVLSMTVLGSLFGLPGIILGTPIAAVMIVLAQALYIGDVLGDHELDPTQKPA